MEVILRDNVDKLGKAGDLVKVKPGYARNFLLPQGLAYEATPGNKKRIEAEAKSRQAKQAAERAAAEGVAAKLNGVKLTLARKAGEENRLFGSITSQDVADALAAAGHEVDKRKIDLEHPIKTLGVHTVPVRVYHDVHAELQLTVVAE
ncbi:MAG TPA: 50S ribosomal protein L9 [Gemmatimonadales bacterium]|nr:50S ribosomal protein L9 [Gemmatimonadales bacterium]